MAKGTVNKVIILGKLGQDPEMKATASGTQVVTLSIATNELGKKDPNTGQHGDMMTEWHRVVLFGKMAENAGKYLSKGSSVYIEGRLQTRKWQDAQGNDKWSTEIIGNEMQFIGGKSDNQQSQPQQSRGAQQNYNHQQAVPKQAPQRSTGFDDFDDDIPF